jgi:hypothetical protein
MKACTHVWVRCGGPGRVNLTCERCAAVVAFYLSVSQPVPLGGVQEVKVKVSARVLQSGRVHVSVQDLMTLAEWVGLYFAQMVGPRPVARPVRRHRRRV